MPQIIPLSIPDFGAMSPGMSSAFGPVAVDSAGAELPENSEIKKILNDVLGAAKLSFSAVAANQNRVVRTGSIEADFKQALETMSPSKREGYAKKANELLNASPNLRMKLFGRAGERDADSHLSIGGFDRFDDGIAPLAVNRKLLGINDSVRISLSELRQTAEGLLLPASALPGNTNDLERMVNNSHEKSAKSGVANHQTLDDIWGVGHNTAPLHGFAKSSKNAEVAVPDWLNFYITQVRCVDETNPENIFSSDEIALAGISVDGTGDTRKIAEVKIGDNFTDGDVKNYSPPWLYHRFSLREGNYWPKNFTVTLILAEQDNGELAKMLSDLYDKVKDKVQKVIEDVISTALRIFLGEKIAIAIGKGVAWVVNEFVEWVISWFYDDIFPPKIANITLPRVSARWHDSNGRWVYPFSRIRTANVYGHGGHYQVRYYWEPA